jgi:uncharacterized membrane protein
MQNPPPGQQEYGNAYNAPPPGTNQQKSAVGLEPNIAAALSYIWIVGLIFFIMEKENRFIRFHALQSILYGVVWVVAVIVLMIVNVIIAIAFGVVASATGEASTIVGMIVWLLSMFIWLVFPLVYLGGLIFAAVKAYQGKTFKLPIIGNMAERMVNK